MEDEKKDPILEEEEEAKEDTVHVIWAFLLLLVCMGPAILIAIIQRAR